MRLFPNLPLRHRLTLISVIASTVALLLAGAGFIAYDQFASKRELARDVAVTAQMLGYNSASALSFDDPASAEATLAALAAKSQIVAACVYDLEGRVFATYPAALDRTKFAPPPAAATERFGPDRLELFRPVVLAGEKIGTLYLRSSLQEMRDRLHRYVLITGAVMIVAMGVAYAFALRLQRAISGPVAELATIASQVGARKNYAVRAVKSSNDELGGLIDGFNDMLGQIEARDRALRTANESLEARVEERTAALRRENAERQRAEVALQTSEAFLQSLLESLPVHIFRKDVAGRITFANRRFCERYGLTVAEAVGKTVYDLLPSAEADRQESLDREIVASGSSLETVEEIVPPGGQPFFLHVIKVPVFDAAGECIGVQGMFLDVTERKRAEARLAEASALLEAMLEHSPDFIYFKDRASRFVRFSNAVLRQFEVATPGELVGKTDADFFTAEHAVPAYEDEQEIIRTGIPIVGKFEKETFPSGRVSWALTTKMPWRDAAGNIVGIFGITKNVTALKQAEEKLAHERDLLRALLDSSPDAIYFKDERSCFVLVSRSKVNKALAHVPDLRERRAARGLPPVAAETDLLAGMSDFDTYREEDARLTFEDEQRILRTGEPAIGRLEKKTYLGGEVRWSLTNKMPWRNPDGTITGTFGISKDVTELKEAEEKLAQLHHQLLAASRQAGMAEVATGVLHNVGNVLNSVNVSATLVTDQVRHTKALSIGKLAALFAGHRDDTARFLTEDPRGRMIPQYLETLAESIAAEHKTMLTELDHLRKNIEHIKDIVAMQQSYARTSGMLEPVCIPDLVEDVLRMNAGSLARHDIDTVRDYQARPVVTTDKHKVMQILINLVRNAKHACDDAGRPGKRIVVRTTADEGAVRIAVIDNGIGIPPENLTRIFAHGFTTRKDGHGFGLHSGALAAKELGGALLVHSDGPDTGASFVLELPVKSEPAPS